MVSYSGQIPKMNCKSSVVVIEHHINIWLSEDCCTLTILKSKTRFKDVLTEVAAMLRVVRVAFVFPAKGGASCAEVSDGQAANLAVLVA